MLPSWFHNLSVAYVASGGLCAMLIAIDEFQHPQHMWIMNIVWPVVALFGSAWIFRQYFTDGRLATKNARGDGT